MRRLWVGLVVLLSFVATATTAPAAPAQTTTAREAYIMDVNTGAVLLDKDSGVRIPTASMSKIMTMAVVFQAIRDGRLRLDDKLTVSEKAWRMEGSKMFVALGSQVSVEDLIKGVIVQSGNDATVVLAEGVAGSEEKFAGMLNEMAARWGLKDSHFMNASGMPDPNHYSTPRDLAWLAYNLITRFPEDYKYYSIRDFTWNNITQQNRNPLLGHVAGADGVKTGHTEEAGFCLIGSAMRDKRRVIMVITGLPSDKDRAAEGTRLMEWALNSFKVANIITKGQKMAEAPVVYGRESRLALLTDRNVQATVPATMRASELTTKIRYRSPLVAPIKAGQAVGTLVIGGPGMAMQEFPLVAANDVAEKGFIGLTFEKMIQAAKNK